MLDPTIAEIAAAHTSIHNHFNQDRHLNRRNIFRKYRAAALSEQPTRLGLNHVSEHSRQGRFAGERHDLPAD